MEPNVRLSFQVSIAVPYATLIKAEWHSDFEHKDLICQNTKYWTRVSWAQKWHRGIVKCLTNCPFGCRSSSHLGEGRLCPVMVGAVLPNSNTKIWQMRLQIQLQCDMKYKLCQWGEVCCPVMVELLASGPMEWGKGWTGPVKAAVSWSQVTMQCIAM